MNALKVFETSGVPVYTTEEGEQVVYATELHKFLKSRRRYANWIKDRLQQSEFIEGEDFITILLQSTGGRPQKEYLLKLDVAKELSMLERNERGRRIRRYFIECEKRYRALILQQIEAAKNAMEFYEVACSAENAYSMAEIVRLLRIKGFGRTKLFAFLREHHVIMKESRLPYQKYCDNGCFRVVLKMIERKVKRVYKVALVTGKGLEFIRRLLGEDRLDSAA